jgi:putative endonuclease
MATVYILKSLNFDITYTGSTTDLIRRLKEHNNGECCYTRKYSPWRLMYREDFIDLSAARKRERYFKSCAGRKFIKKNLFSQ